MTKRTTYPREFKAEAVRLLEGGETVEMGTFYFFSATALRGRRLASNPSR